MFCSRPLLTASMTGVLGLASVAMAADAVSRNPSASSAAPLSTLTVPSSNSNSLPASRNLALQNAIGPKVEQTGQTKAYRELVRSPEDDVRSAIQAVQAGKDPNSMCAIPLSTVNVGRDKQGSLRLDMDPGIRQNGKEKPKGKEQANAMRDFDRIAVAPAARSCSQAWVNGGSGGEGPNEHRPKDESRTK